MSFGRSFAPPGFSSGWPHGSSSRRVPPCTVRAWSSRLVVFCPSSGDYRFGRPISFRKSPPPLPTRPKTVKDYEVERESLFMTLDQAIEMALRNAEVIRVLQGTNAGSSGQTIYDPAIQNTLIDVERSRFDPSLNTGIDISRNESPGAVLNPAVPGSALIEGPDITRSNLTAGLSTTKVTGGTLSLNASASPANTAPNATSPLNPLTPTSLDLSYNQPLLRGRGLDVNLAPVVIARINTERSLYQLKGSVQELVRSVIDGYWQLVAARVRLWALEQQVEQLETAFRFFDAELQVGRGDLGDTAQAQVSLSQFRANLVAARAEVLDREAALFNVFGLPPRPDVRLIPTTAPSRVKIDVDWQSLVTTASNSRPDIIQRKLNIHADEQQLRVACNRTLPQLDAVGLVRMNGLGGQAPNGNVITSDFFQFNDVQVGLSLQTPLGQRSARAQLRQDQLTLARDQALLRQDLHAVTHQLAASLRNLEQFFAQYEAFQKVRTASRVNLNRQFDFFKVGGIATDRPNYLNVLQAVTDWGNAINSEANALAQYNGEIANLSLQRGTILEEHGVVFQEELYGSVGPFGVCPDQPYSQTDYMNCQCYPGSTAVAGMTPQYSDGGRAAEESFELESIFEQRGKPSESEEIDVDEECNRLDRDAPESSETDMQSGQDDQDLTRPLPVPRPNPKPELLPNRPPTSASEQPANPPGNSLDTLRQRMRELMELTPGASRPRN